MGKKNVNYNHTYISLIPSPWMKKAFQVPGRDTMKVANLLWLSYSWKWNHHPQSRNVWISNKMGEWFGLDPKTRTRALDRLAEAGLIKFVQRGRGKTPVVTLIFTKVNKAEYAE